MQDLTQTAANHAVDQALDPDRLVTPAQLAERWNVSRPYIYTLMNAGLPTLSLGRARRIRVSEADAWLASQQQGAA